jgi:HEAT repeat protein
MRHLWENSDPVRAETRALQRRAIAALASAKPSDRVAATYELEHLGSGDGSIAIPALIAALEDREPAVCVAAAGALGTVGSVSANSPSGAEFGRAAATALIRGLTDPDAAVRVAAVNALGSIGSALVTSGSGAELARIDREAVMNALAGRLRDGDVRVRRTAIGAMTSHPWGSDPPRALAEALKDESAENRAAVIGGLTTFRQGLDPWAQVLLRLAEHDPDPSVRERALNTLNYAFKPPAVTAAVVPAFAASLRCKDARVRSLAASLLGELRADARAAIPELVRVLNEPHCAEGASYRIGPRNFDAGCAAASALGRIAPGSVWAKDVVAALTEVVRSGPPGRRRWAVSTLAEFGPDAEESIPILITLMHDGATGALGHAASAAAALGRIAPGTPSEDRAFAALLQALRSELWMSRARALEAVRHFGPRAAEALPRIRELMNDRNAEVRYAAARSLRAIESLGASAAAPP